MCLNAQHWSCVWTWLVFGGKSWNPNPQGLPNKVGDWILLRRKWQPTPVLLPGKSHGLRSLVSYSPWGGKESDTTERLFPFLSFPFLCFPVILNMVPKCPNEAFFLSDFLTVRGGHEKSSNLGRIKWILTEISGRVFAFLIKKLPFPSFFLLLELDIYLKVE